MDKLDLTDAWMAVSTGSEIPRRGDPFFQFITAWLAFNSLYADRFATIDGDWRQIEAFSSDEQAQAAHAELLDIPEYAAAVEVLERQGVSDVRTGRHRQITNAQLLRDVLRCVYQVRCNLIHGGKHPEDGRDRALAHAGFVVVANLVSMYLRGIRIPSTPP